MSRREASGAWAETQRFVPAQARARSNFTTPNASCAGRVPGRYGRLRSRSSSLAAAAGVVAPRAGRNLPGAVAGSLAALLRLTIFRTDAAPPRMITMMRMMTKGRRRDLGAGDGTGTSGMERESGTDGAPHATTRSMPSHPNTVTVTPGAAGPADPRASQLGHDLATTCPGRALRTIP